MLQIATDRFAGAGSLRSSSGPYERSGRHASDTAPIETAASNEPRCHASWIEATQRAT